MNDAIDGLDHLHAGKPAVEDILTELGPQPRLEARPDCIDGLDRGDLGGRSDRNLLHRQFTEMIRGFRVHFLSR